MSTQTVQVTAVLIRWDEYQPLNKSRTLRLDTLHNFACELFLFDQFERTNEPYIKSHSKLYQRSSIDGHEFRHFHGTRTSVTLTSLTAGCTKHKLPVTQPVKTFPGPLHADRTAAAAPHTSNVTLFWHWHKDVARRGSIFLVI